MTSLMPLGASPDNVIVAGFSSGSFMTSQLLVAFPDIFKCAGMLNGGLPGSGLRHESEY